MKKILAFVFVLMIGSIVACQQPAKQDSIEKKGAMADSSAQKTVENHDAMGISSDAVDGIGSGMNEASSTDNDLSDDGLSDFDSGLQDVQNI